MRSYLDIVIDLKDGNEVSKQELGTALLFAADQLAFANKDIEKLMNDKHNSPLFKQLIKEHQEIRFKARKNPLQQWFGEELPNIK